MLRLCHRIAGASACDSHWQLWCLHLVPPSPPTHILPFACLPQGIRAADRSRLLALCLAALESQVAALPPASGLLAAGPAQWRQLAAALLALSSVAAAAAWLGYVPVRLLQAAAAQVAATDAALLQTAGLQAAAATLQQQAAAARSGGSQRTEDDSDGSGEVAWYCLEEKLQLYSSVLRLLCCATIEQQQQREQQQASASALPPSLASTVGSGSEDALAAASSSSSSGDLVRQQARAFLQQQHVGSSPVGAGIRCAGQCVYLLPGGACHYSSCIICICMRQALHLQHGTCPWCWLFPCSLRSPMHLLVKRCLVRAGLP